MIQTIMRRLKKDEKGFTLIELVVVIAIIGILAVVLVPKFGGFNEDAKVSAAKADLSNFKTIAETIYAKNGSYPGNFAAMASCNVQNPPKDPWGHDYTFSTTNGYTISTGTNSPAYSVTPTSGP